MLQFLMTQIAKLKAAIATISAKVAYESVAITAKEGYTIPMNRSFKVGSAIFVICYISKDEGTIGTSWETVANITGLTLGASMIGAGACNGAKDVSRVEIQTNGDIAIQAISASTATGMFVNMCVGKL